MGKHHFFLYISPTC